MPLASTHAAPPPKRRRRTDTTTRTNRSVDGCAHYTRAVATFAQQLRERAANGDSSKSTSKSKSAVHDVERLERYCRAGQQDQKQQDGSVREDVYECLSCSFTGVREYLSGPIASGSEDSDDSFMAHAILNDHPLGFLVRKQQLYCACCRDFIYPEALLEAKGGGAHGGLSINVRRLQSKVWRTGITNSSSSSSFPPTTPRRPSRRGLVNMGNTCYMNVVLQAFAHNALLQHYFLVAKGHGTTICKQTRKLQHQQAVAAASAKQTSSSSPTSLASSSPSPSPPSTRICLGCDLSEFMATLSPAAALSAPASPFVPHKIMEAFWNFAPSFIGSQQHDAHEFFLAFLNVLHTHTHQRVFVPGAMSPRFTPKGKSLCDCVAHQHFSGVLVSQVECTVCDQVSSTFDPFLDLSLSLDVLGSDANGNDTKDTQSSSSSPSPPLSLDTLLHKFTAEEHLRGINRVYCRRCNAYTNMSKRLRIHRLPNVLVVHIKRLDFHKQRKLSGFVQFPLKQLDLEEFRADRSSDTAAPNSEPVTPRGVDNVGYPGDDHEDPDASLYDLAAMVNHHGDSVQGGHYTAFIQSPGGELSEDGGEDDWSPQLQWFLFDDTKVTSATEAQVLESQA